MKRLATAAIAILVVLLITQYSPGWLFATIVGLLSALMLEEYLNLGLAAGRSRPGPWFLIPGALIAPLFWVSPNLAMLGFSIMTLGLAASCVFDSDLTKAFDRLAVGLSGLLYCCLPISFLTLYERKAIYVLFAIIWAGDSCAYYGGRALGRHKLSPRVSPNKTVEGAVSGLVGSVVAGAPFGVWVLGPGSPGFTVDQCLRKLPFSSKMDIRFNHSSAT